MSFLQSPEWEQFQNSLGRRTWRAENALLIEHALPGGFRYLYSPRPELGDEASIKHQESRIGNFLKEAKEIGREAGAIFLKIDPSLERQRSKLKGQMSRPIQPRKTTRVDLRKSEEELLQAMREKTRYNIRLAERKRVFADHDSYNAFGAFWRLMEETAARKGFSPHSKEHYKALLGIRSRDFYNEIFFARYEKSIIAAALVNFYAPSGTVTYLHGASSRDNREVMAPHLLHWRIIQEAKRLGFRHYDFWGIDEKKWPGITRFKLGFGGEVVEYPPSVDIVYRPMWYLAYRIARSFRKNINL